MSKKFYLNHESITNDIDIEGRNSFNRNGLPMQKIQQINTNRLSYNNNNRNDDQFLNTNRFSYNRNEEPALNIRIQLNKNTASELNNERFYNNNNNNNNNNNLMNHNSHIESKKSMSSYMDNNSTFVNIDTVVEKNKTKLKSFQNKKNVIAVREAINEPVEDFVEEPRTINKTKREVDRKAATFNNADKEKIKHGQRSTSTLETRLFIPRSEIERKRSLKNNTTQGYYNQDGSSSNASSESEDEEVISKIINAKSSYSNKKQPILHEQDEDEAEEDFGDTSKIFPVHTPKKNDDNSKHQLFILREMYDLLKNRDTTLDFIMKRAPQNSIVKCRIRRTKRKMATHYTMFVELPDGTEVPLMQTKRKRSAGVYILINALEIFERECNEQEEFERFIQIPCGKLKSRSKLKVIFDSFSLANNGKKTGSFAKGLNFLGRKSKKIQIDNSDESDNFKEFLRIDYDNSILKLSQPLKFTVSLVNNSEKGANKFLEYQKLVTKLPKFDKEKQKYILDFSSRVQQASTNNFQVILANPDYQDTIILQSGKAKNNEYICDYSYPLSAFEAFGIVLTSFNRRIV